MKKTISVIIACLLIVLMLPLSSFAASGSISVNGETFKGTLAEAIKAGKNGTVTISGTVYTLPIGRNDGTVVRDVTIQGVNNAKLLVSDEYSAGADDNLDVITVTGDNVVIKDLLIDATRDVDFALSTLGCNHVVIENVTAQHGKRGSVNIMTDGSVQFINVKALNSRQAGFYFEACGDASNVKFTNCSTDGSWYRSGVLICNAYGPTYNVDASGITCYEGYFAVHDRSQGSLRDKERQQISYSAVPKNAAGNPIDTSIAMNYTLEKAYLCIRFGVTDSDTKSAYAYVDSNAYGFDSRVYFDSSSDAKSFLHDGEHVVKIGNIFTLIINWFLRLFDSLRINFD